MKHYLIYHSGIPDFISEFSETDVMQRLRGIGMNCGCEYTSFERFSHLQPYSRFEHSIGAALIVWHFTNDIRQSVAALLHDVASPVFAHVVDFMKGDHLSQEATEEGTREIIERSKQLQSLLKRYELDTEDVCDYHRYPIADNDSPKLSADRLEYSCGNLINYGFFTKEEIRKIYDNLVIGTNEENETELMFLHREEAKRFAFGALKCSRIYVADEDRYSMEVLAGILRHAIDCKVLEEKDLWTSESQVVAKLTGNEETMEMWEYFCRLKRIVRSEENTNGEYRKIFAKKRFIDPYVKDEGRLTRLSESFRNDLNSFINESQDCWIRGIS